jgi:hypothetical protein
MRAPTPIDAGAHNAREGGEFERETWPADQVERWPISKLIPYARNAGTHSDEQVALIAASIREWGWTVPVLVDEQGTLIAGHGRVLAAQQLGITDVPTMVARGWTQAQIQAYRLTDNQLALNIIWVKQHFVFSRGDYHWQHEPCWYAVRGTGEWRGDRKQTTVWQIANASAFRGTKDDISSKHGTQNPVECMQRPIENNSSPGKAMSSISYGNDHCRPATKRRGGVN